MAADVALIQAIFDRLHADPALVALVSDGIYDVVPAEAPARYVSLGPTTIIPDDVDCIDGEEITVQIDAWTRSAYDTGDVRRIAAALKKALHRVDLDLGENALVLLEHDGTRILDDPDPLVHHGVVTFTAIVETP